MINRILEHVRVMRSWVLNPGRLLDRFLDHLDKLNAFVVPAGTDNPSYRYAEVEPRRGQFGA